MCVVSMVGDFYDNKWRGPYIHPVQYPPATPWPPNWIPIEETVKPSPEPIPVFTPPVSRQEFEQFKKEVLDAIELLKRAKQYDEKNNEPDCEVEDKMKVIRAAIRSVGLDPDEVLK